MTYYYSACVGIRTTDCSVLCDPWFTDGIYDGAWYQYPKLKDPLRKIGRYDFIYISHIHPDHYDPVFLRSYRVVHPRSGVVIGREGADFLSQKLFSDGIDHSRASTQEFGETEIGIFPNHVGSSGESI